MKPTKKYVLLVPDGTADRDRTRGCSPLVAAHTPNLDFLAREGVCGRMQTLYPDLPHGSIVALLGMLGWDPRRFCPGGRSSCELLALGGVELRHEDLAFRANLVRVDGGRLVSYNADYVLSEQALPLVERINLATRDAFPDFELYHNSDFRNTLVVRGAAANPRRLRCPEPHESEGLEFDLARLVQGSDAASAAVADRLNHYLAKVGEVLAAEPANMIFPWSASRALQLSSFKENTGFSGRSAIVGSMDFLKGIARAGGLEFFPAGNGRPDTDYRAKGRLVVDLLAAGYRFVICHVNGPDEAAHMGDLDLKIRSIESFDEAVAGPVIEYFQTRPEELGGVLVAPDHYTNVRAARGNTVRSDAHSLDPVPFAIWNGEDRDEVTSFGEDEVLSGRYGVPAMSHLDLLRLLGLVAPAAVTT